jgi:DNA-directed RNA polymerase specialized sigma subunit
VWENHRLKLPRYKALTLSQERLLISKAQQGQKAAIEELVLRHIGFIMFRIHKRAFPSFIGRFRDDILSQSIFILYDKIETYDLSYRNRCGQLKPVRFASYIWKRIDGFILDFLKKELSRENIIKSMYLSISQLTVE